MEFSQGDDFSIDLGHIQTGKEFTMSCNSAIYTVNATNAVVTTENNAFVQIPFGSVIRRFGRALSLDGGTIVTCGQGYFDCEISLTLLPTTAGTITAQLFKDGVAVPGAFASGTAAAAGNSVPLSINALIRNAGCANNSIISVMVNADCTVANCASVIEKL